MILRYIAVFLVLFGARVYAEPLKLSVVEISKQLADETVDVTVIEQYAAGDGKAASVTYTGIPLEVLLAYLYPKQWDGFDGEIYFYALDGYLSIIDAAKARHGGGYMSFARADGEPFTARNINQQQRDVPLAPFYLVWDNLKHPDLQQSTAYAWPYQVFRVELVSSEMLQYLLPANASPAVKAGFEAFKNNCISCHNINGFGGKKFGMDIRQSIKGRTRKELYDWIDKPLAINKFTAMPPFDPGITGDNRQRTINQIIDYLQTF